MVDRPLTSGGHALELDADAFGWLRDSNDAKDDVAELRRRMDQDGYLFLPGYLDREAIRAVRLEICQEFEKEGLLDPAYPVEDAVSKPGVQMYFRPDIANRLKGLKEVIYGQTVMDFYSRLLGGPAMHYDFTWMRAIAKGKGTYPHCDVVYMGRGTQNVFTAWIPFGDVPLEVGGLVVLEGTHRNETLRNGYCKLDVDTTCKSDPSKSELHAAGYSGFGELSSNITQVRRDYGRRILTCPEYRMGDLLTFSIFTAHGSLDNSTHQIRVSTDTRYQLASEPADPRWIGENPPAHGGNSLKEMIC